MNITHLIDYLRQEANRNAQMQGDKAHHTQRRRKTFRGRNHHFTQAADILERVAALPDEWDTGRAAWTGGAYFATKLRKALGETE